MSGRISTTFLLSLLLIAILSMTAFSAGKNGATGKQDYRGSRAVAKAIRYAFVEEDPVFGSGNHQDRASHF